MYQSEEITIDQPSPQSCRKTIPPQVRGSVDYSDLYGVKKKPKIAPDSPFPRSQIPGPANPSLEKNFEALRVEDEISKQAREIEHLHARIKFLENSKKMSEKLHRDDEAKQRGEKKDLEEENQRLVAEQEQLLAKNAALSEHNKELARRYLEIHGKNQALKEENGELGEVVKGLRGENVRLEREYAGLKREWRATYGHSVRGISTRRGGTGRAARDDGENEDWKEDESTEVPEGGGVWV
ncbi:hypothetical protein B7494_g8429 [Chlorociboria aeruginascens]|nr:hypothetical protein B7494_g8429 [Chlorociboria aeruginascens]